MSIAKAHSEANGGSFKKLLIWQRAVQLGLATHRLTASFPDWERFGLVDQLRRASVSVASNIAEGYGRATQGEFIQFLGHARGSNCELQTQLIIAQGLRFGSEADLRTTEELSAEVARMLVALMKRLRSR